MPLGIGPAHIGRGHGVGASAPTSRMRAPLSLRRAPVDHLFPFPPMAAAPLSRRSFLRAAALHSAALGLAATGGVWTGRQDPTGYDPWIEVNEDHLRHNVSEILRVVGNRPILATVKNNAYGLGLERVGPLLDRTPGIAGLAVVKVEEAVRLREAGCRRPILLMSRASEEEMLELVRFNVRLAPFSQDDPARLSRTIQEMQRPVAVHLYLDTGMGRLGMPHHRALPWIEEMAQVPGIQIEGAFMAFTESPEFDREQLRRFRELAATVRGRGIGLGRLHAASSNHITFLDDAHLDMVRPGLNLFGAHVAGGREAQVLELRPAIRLRARVLRVERLRAGDSVSYGRNYVAEEEVWVATIPVGHADGYPRQAVEGARVLVGQATYPVIGAVSASHCVIEVGRDRRVEPGEVATLLGPDHPDVHPNELAEWTGRSVYDVLMHLSPGFPARRWGRA